MPDSTPSDCEILRQVALLRGGLQKMRDDPSRPHLVIDPTTGRVIDVLDGNTDRMIDRLERLALLRLRLRRGAPLRGEV